MHCTQFRSIASYLVASAGAVLILVAILLMPLEEATAQCIGAGCSLPACGTGCQGTCNGQSAPCDGWECTQCEQNITQCPSCMCYGLTSCKCKGGQNA